jgi:hypothetical protein
VKEGDISGSRSIIYAVERIHYYYYTLSSLFFAYCGMIHTNDTQRVRKKGKDAAEFE